MSVQGARSYLFVPATRPERIAKALACGADAVIVDFEDAVAPADKVPARDALAKNWGTLRQQATALGRGLLVRVNALDTPYHAGDLAWCQAMQVSDVVLPKAAPDALADLRRALPQVRCYPLLETAAGFEALPHVARAAGVNRLLFGSIDLMFDLDVVDDDAPLDYFRSQLVASSRAAGLPAPVDGVCTAIHEAQMLAQDTARARRFGFGAKLLIHPNQVESVHATLAPSTEECTWAERVVAAAHAADGAAVAVDGKMIDLPVLKRAHRILLRAEQANSPAAGRHSA
jgi:citrate lyase subunit beta/citryl-CoA lyase